MLRGFAIAAAALLLSACATSGKQLLADGTKALGEAPLCCTTLATARRVPLPNQPADVVIDQTAQAFNFGGNKAFFVLYELPRFEDTYSIVLTSFANGTLQDSALFIPRVATYDAEFKLLRYFDEKTLRNRGNNLERTIFINPSDRAERYVAVYGSDLSATIERAYSMNTVTAMPAGPYTFYMHSGVDGKSTLRSAPAGKLKVEVQGLTGAKAAR
ncbi:MAG: hypothetical protein JWP22_404 [Ramlibacter sp.]|nr:hypothetical protein [Ramlibacter sp.]